MAGHGKHPFCDSNPGIQFAGKGRGNGRETFIFPRKGKGKNSKTGTVQKPKPKCTICEGKHRNMIWCKELTKYLPYGNDQKTLPSSLCLICLGTEFKSGKQCNHKNNRVYQKTVCPASNRHFLYVLNAQSIFLHYCTYEKITNLIRDGQILLS